MSSTFHTISVDKWRQFSLPEQMANIGAEVGRALKWKKKEKWQLQQNATYRCLELLNLTLAVHHSPSVLKEVARTKELLLDHLLFENKWQTSAAEWEKYFFYFNKLARSS